MSTIVIIDDQRVNREIMAALAATVEEDVEVAAFASPLDALAFAEHKPPDLVITDFKMKPINGDEFIRRFRRLPSCGFVPTVVVTAFEDTELRDRAIEAGSTDFFQSPINHGEFQSRSRALLLLARQRQSLVGQIGEVLTAVDIEPSPEFLAQLSATEMVEDMLQTVNGQLRITLDSLRDSERDLALLSETSGIAAVFVTKDFRIRRYTPVAAKILDLGPDHIGEPLEFLRMNFVDFDPTADFFGFESDGELVKVVSTADGGRQYVVRLVPYLDPLGHVDGAALTFAEIGRRKFRDPLKLH